jgi:hypothetical protein
MRDERHVRGPLPHTLVFETTVTAVDPPRLVRYRAEGGLRGDGQVTLTQTPNGTDVVIDWSVHTTARWLNVLSPIVRPLLEWNHRHVMRRGERGLDRTLEAQGGGPGPR